MDYEDYLDQDRGYREKEDIVKVILYKKPQVLRQRLTDLLAKEKSNTERADILHKILDHHPYVALEGVRVFSEHIKTINVYPSLRLIDVAYAHHLKDPPHQDHMTVGLLHFIVLKRPELGNLEDILRVVIDVHDTNVNQRCEDLTPLDMLCNLFEVEESDEREGGVALRNAVACLLRLGADPNVPCAVFGRTPIDSAQAHVNRLQKYMSDLEGDSPRPAWNLGEAQIELRAWQDVVGMMAAYTPARAVAANKKRKEPSTDVDDNLLMLLESPYYHDVRLLLGDNTFTAHREVLADRSTYFHALFKIGMKETTLDEITLPDVDASLFEVVLRSIYKGAYDIGDGDAVDVIGILEQVGRFGTRFDIREMTDSVQASLSAQNVIDVYKAAVHCDLTSLIDRARKFIIRHHAELVRSVDLSNADDCKLLVEVLRGREYTVSLGVRR